MLPSATVVREDGRRVAFPDWRNALGYAWGVLKLYDVEHSVLQGLFVFQETTGEDQVRRWRRRRVR